MYREVLEYFEVFSEINKRVQLEVMFKKETQLYRKYLDDLFFASLRLQNKLLLPDRLFNLQMVDTHLDQIQCRRASSGLLETDVEKTQELKYKYQTQLASIINARIDIFEPVF